MNRRYVVIALVLAAIVIGAFIFTSLGDPFEPYGTVIGKDFAPAHEETYTRQAGSSCIPTGKGQSVCTPIYVQDTRWVPDRWRVRLRHGDEDGWIEVTSYVYEMTHVGEELDFRTDLEAHRKDSA